MQLLNSGSASWMAVCRMIYKLEDVFADSGLNRLTPVVGVKPGGQIAGHSILFIVDHHTVFQCIAGIETFQRDIQGIRALADPLCRPGDHLSILVDWHPLGFVAGLADVSGAKKRGLSEQAFEQVHRENRGAVWGSRAGSGRTSGRSAGW